MDNQGDAFPGGSPLGRNNNTRAGSGLPNNIFSSSLRSVRIDCSFPVVFILRPGEGAGDEDLP